MATPSNRPTSPHLQIYQLPLTGLVSISHRITGVFLVLGWLLVVFLLMAIAAGQQSYQDMQALMGLGLIRLCYWGFVYALFFHLCHGVRHLFWDAGFGFKRDDLDRWAKIELGCSLALTLLAYIFV